MEKSSDKDSPTSEKKDQQPTGLLGLSEGAGGLGASLIAQAVAAAGGTLGASSGGLGLSSGAGLGASSFLQGLTASGVNPPNNLGSPASATLAASATGGGGNPQFASFLEALTTSSGPGGAISPNFWESLAGAPASANSGAATPSASGLPPQLNASLALSAGTQAALNASGLVLPGGGPTISWEQLNRIASTSSVAPAAKKPKGDGSAFSPLGSSDPEKAPTLSVSDDLKQWLLDHGASPLASLPTPTASSPFLNNPDLLSLLATPKGIPPSATTLGVPNTPTSKLGPGTVSSISAKPMPLVVPAVNLSPSAAAAGSHHQTPSTTIPHGAGTAPSAALPPRKENPSGTSLEIEEQPVPKCLFINRRATPAFKIRAVFAPPFDISEVKEISPARACLIWEAPEPVEVTGNIEKFELEHLTATFPNLKFAMGTHQKLVQVYFEASITTTRGETLTLSSAPSEPFVVCTNIKQWVKAEGMVLKKVAFGERTQVEWSLFVQHLKREFQLSIASDRLLSEDDLELVRSRAVDKSDVVTQATFNDFWTNWYGPIMKALYQKHGRTLWERRLVFGFVSTQRVDVLLKGTAPGTFLIRFIDVGEASHGQFVISYMNQDGTVHHYKMNEKEQKMAIQEFLGSKKTLSSILLPQQPDKAKNRVPSPSGAGALLAKSDLLKECKPSRSSGKRKKANSDDESNSGAEEQFDTQLS